MNHHRDDTFANKFVSLLACLGAREGHYFQYFGKIMLE